MKIIIDTHALLWLFSNDDKLSEKAGKLIKNRSNEVFVSIASFWEISIKLSLSKLVLDVPFALLFEESEKLDIKILDIQKVKDLGIHKIKNWKDDLKNYLEKYDF